MSQLVLNKDVQIRGKMVIPNNVLMNMSLAAEVDGAFMERLEERFGEPMTVAYAYHPDGLIFQWYPSSDDKRP